MPKLASVQKKPTRTHEHLDRISAADWAELSEIQLLFIHRPEQKQNAPDSKSSWDVESSSPPPKPTHSGDYPLATRLGMAPRWGRTDVVQLLGYFKLRRIKSRGTSCGSAGSMHDRISARASFYSEARRQQSRRAWPGFCQLVDRAHA
jgi:hypothetical protein